ncbi:uncharacterized protein PHALS_13807 [Plasmopara halstedii]|uniref:Uncharacterized protein n=1 Tax=Plasmopara halstedii TaxID=4781 RepID=A0A0P1AQJ5_PLAHL|nr:uncharacterized protein PHALS_13807 [Plasmopara halstedii]CEG43616.1 hypothetical protein PHALS_13807 [Plasmopara halstedii]|eukprot:XP_024579985.1 hypothetical protein PHALS_13807 [Plasmopara halstedii]
MLTKQRMEKLSIFLNMAQQKHTNKRKHDQPASTRKTSKVSSTNKRVRKSKTCAKYLEDKGRTCNNPVEPIGKTYCSTHKNEKPVYVNAKITQEEVELLNFVREHECVGLAMHHLSLWIEQEEAESTVDEETLRKFEINYAWQTDMNRFALTFGKIGI